MIGDMTNNNVSIHHPIPVNFIGYPMKNFINPRMINPIIENLNDFQYLSIALFSILSIKRLFD